MKSKDSLQWKVSLFLVILSAGFVWALWEGKSPDGNFPGALFLAVLLALGAVIWVSVRRFFIQPLNEMTGVVEKFAEGLLNWRVRLGTRKDELGCLGNELNRMAQAVGEKIDRLAKSLAETEALLGGMEEGVLILDLNGRIKDINGAMSLLLSQTTPSDVGKHYLEVFRDPELNDVIQATLAEKKGQRRNMTLLGQPGKAFQVQSSLVQYPKNGNQGVIVVFHDVTDLKRLERIRQDFVANVSHELRTPLTAIKGFVEALRDGVLENPTQAERFLRVIEEHVNRMEKIVSDLLLLSEMESPDRSLKKEVLSFSALISAAVESLQPLAEGKKQTLEVRMAGELPAIQGDSQKIHQVILNLLHNALLYTPENGVITIEARPAPGGGEISVGDDGIGISPEDLPRIFERFYRVDKGRSRELGGTGLGLSIVKHIVEAHGGQVRVASKPGQGSRFTFFLPRIP